MNTVEDLSNYLRCLEDEAYSLRQKVKKAFEYSESLSLSIKSSHELMDQYMDKVKELSYKLRGELWNSQAASHNHKQ
jgi:hypothetical protein